MTALPGTGVVVIRNWATATPNDGAATYRELLRVPSLAVGRFVAPPGHEDSQEPHSEDEIYFVTAGQAHLILGGRTHPVQAGSVAYVPAGTAHRFTNIRARIEVLVFFAPCPPAV